MKASCICISFALFQVIDHCWSKEVDLGCDPGWYYSNEYCYYFSTSKVVTQQQALDECEVYTSYLLRIESSDELAFINGTVQTMLSDGYWTDLSNLRFDGTEVANPVWQWGDSQPADTTLINWESYPSDANLASCGAVDPTVKFSNWNCNRRLGYICKIDNAMGPSTTNPIVDINCPENWRSLGSDCYYVSNTSDPTQLLTWSDAFTKCENMVKFSVMTNPTQLLTLTDPQDEAMVFNIMVTVVKNPSLFWTALKYVNNAWTWQTGDTFQSNYIHWAKEPDNVRNHEHCAIVKPDATFADQDCNSKFNFICRKDTSFANTDYYFGCHGWQRAGDKCYQFYDNPQSSWHDARAMCQEVNGDLLHLDNFDDRRWVEWQMSGETHMNMYWTGLNDQQKEGQYTWADGRLANMSLIIWNEEPNSWKGDEDCVNIFTDGGVNDADCYVQAKAICEYTNIAGLNCPSGWISEPNSNRCYFISTDSQTFTWSEARAFCTQNKAQQYGQTTLLALNSKAKWDFIGKTLANYTFLRHGWWTAMNDIKTDGIWVNADSNLPVDPSLIKWRSQPSDPTGSKDCAAVSWSGRHYVFDCRRKLGFICVSYAHGVGSGSSKMLVNISVLLEFLFFYHLLKTYMTR